MAYVFTFLGGMLVGSFTGLMCFTLCSAAKESERKIDICKDCFGASMGDCPTCPRRKDKVDDVQKQ